MKQRLPRPPSHLSEKSKKLWTQLTRDWGFHILQIQVLQQGLESMDLAEACRRRIAETGLLLETAKRKDGITNFKSNPLLKTMKEAKQVFLRCMMQLNFKVPEEETHDQ